MFLDFSSASSNTGSGGTKQALSATQLAEVRGKHFHEYFHSNSLFLR